MNDDEFLKTVADFYESHGRDEGGYSNETRAEFQRDAERIRMIARRMIPIGPTRKAVSEFVRFLHNHAELQRDREMVFLKQPDQLALNDAEHASRLAGMCEEWADRLPALLDADADRQRLEYILTYSRELRLEPTPRAQAWITPSREHIDKLRAETAKYLAARSSDAPPP